MSTPSVSPHASYIEKVRLRAEEAHVPGAAQAMSGVAESRPEVPADEFFLFGVPNASLWPGAHYRKPFPTVVLQNDQWTTGTVEVARAYPEGYAQRAATSEGGRFDEPRLDLAKLAESAGAYGVNVSEPGGLRARLEEAVGVVRSGTPAVVAVQVGS